MKTEILNQFQGRSNVRHIIKDNGVESWLTQEISFGDETFVKGACKLNTVENETKHVLFLFNSDDEEVGRYYLCKSLQGKTPSELVELKSDLVFFECFNPESKSWVPCVRLSSKGDDSQTSLRTIKISKPIINRNNDNNSFDGKASMKKLYTEEMFKQEIADQEEKDLLEYGTTDEKKIAQIKKDKKDNRNFWIFIIIVGIIMYMFMGLIAKCTGSKFDPFKESDPEWQYRHTDRIE
jgi:hypothetical protein